MQNPLLLPFLAIAAGIYASRLTEFGRVEAAVSGGVFLSLALVAWRFASARSARWAALAALAFGGIAAERLHRPVATPVIDYESGETLLFQGCVTEAPVWFDGGERFVIELDRKARARVNLYLKERQEPPRLHYGQRVEFEGRVRLPRNFGNPGSFDYAGYLARRDIFWNISVSSSAEVRVLDGSCGSAVKALLVNVRSWALERLDRLSAGDAFAAGMSRAILLGDDSRLERIWTEHFRRTGTYHALVISGLHLTTLAACFLFVLRVCGLGPVWSLGVTAAIGWGYTLLVGGETPVTRAAAGLTLFLGARIFFRRPRLLNILAAIGIVFLLADPPQLFDASFHLSFLSVALIGAFAAPLLDRTAAPYSRALRGLGAARVTPSTTDPRLASFRVEMRLLAETIHFVTRLPLRACQFTLTGAGRLLLFFYNLFAVSAVIQIGLMLPMVIYFHRVSWSGFSANLLVVPLTNAAVPLGLMAILTGWKPLAAATGWLLKLSLVVVQWHAAFEPAWRVPPPPAWLAWAVLVALALSALAVASSRLFRIGAALCATTAVVAVLVAHPFTPEVERGALEVTAIDVGQGDSLLIASPEGRLMLVDGGGFPLFGRRSKPALDLGEDVVSPYLWSRSIRRLDVVVATHAHEDHIGGLAALIDNFQPTELWSGANDEDDPAWRTLREHARSRGVKVLARRAGERFGWGGAGVEVLSPQPGEVSSARTRNNDSLVLRLTHRASSILLTGDIERGIEQRLVHDVSLRRTDVLKVAHHGSKTSTGALFLDQVRPAFAIVSAGYENVYRFPHPDVLDRLAETRTSVFRTDLDGLVTLRSDGRRFSARRFRQPGGITLLPPTLLD